MRNQKADAFECDLVFKLQKPYIWMQFGRVDLRFRLNWTVAREAVIHTTALSHFASPPIFTNSAYEFAYD